MNRREFLKDTLVAVAATSSMTLQSDNIFASDANVTGTQQKPMNLLFIMSDEHSRNVYGAYKSPYVKTPNLDRLANNGTIFKNAYCNFPICVPSRASMTIGDYASKNSYFDNSTGYSGAQEGFGHRLTAQGYKVTTIGKLHYKGNMPETGFPDQRIPMHIKDGKGAQAMGIRDGSIRSSVLGDEVAKAGEGESPYYPYDTEIAKRAVDFLKTEANNTDKPWCLYVGLLSPHFPLLSHKEYLDMYRPFEKKVPFPKQFKKSERPMHPMVEYYRTSTGQDRDFTDEQVLQAVAAYYALTTFLDDQVGKILAALKETGLDKNTRIIYTADHGDTIGDHAVFFKSTLYEGSVGVPLVVAGPDIPKGKVVEHNASLIDIFPTVLDCVGAEFKEEDRKLPGVSLWKLAKGEINVNRPVFAEYHASGSIVGSFMIRKGNYKLVYFAEGYRPQLFDLKKDPDELVDLAPNKKYADVLKDLIRELYKIGDPEKINCQVKAGQQALLVDRGGRKAVMNTLKGHTPPPKDFQ